MRPCAHVIGDPIAHSRSPLIHGFWLNVLGIDADYGRVHVTPGDLPRYIANSRTDPQWRGCNVTMPHKQTVMDLIDDVDSLADMIGAVNTIVRSGDRLIGYNTDVTGIAEPLSHSTRTIGQYANHVATYAQIIGAGGAARAAAAALGRKCDLEFYNRTPEKAVALAEQCGLPAWFGMDLHLLGPIRNEEDTVDDQRYSHIIVNASPMGMAGYPSVLIDFDRYYPDTIVLEMVYSPVETSLLAAARARGLRTIDGLEMLIAQAALAFELFFGKAPPRERDDELRALLTA